VPPGFTYPMMAYDARDGYVVLFGDASGSRNDTWTFQSGHWSDLTSSLHTAPLPRVAAAMAYDRADGYVVLFGGVALNCTGASCVYRYLNDTWKFAQGQWTDLRLKHSPSTRFGEGMTYDSADRVVLLFGGYQGVPGNWCSCYGSWNDTWEFARGSWSLVTPSTGAAPSARSLFAFVDDPAAGYVLLFGGCLNTAYGCTLLNDTWRFLSGSWKLLTPSAAPAPQSSTSIAFDGSRHLVVLFGAPTGAGSTSGTTWVFTAGNWIQIAFPGQFSPPALGQSSPGSGWSRALLFDPVLHRDILFDSQPSVWLLDAP
jgi:hypothetical protein